MCGQGPRVAVRSGNGELAQGMTPGRHNWSMLRGQC